MNSELIIAIVSITCVLILLNTIFLGIIFFMRRRMAVVNTWPSTMGTVTNSYLEQRSSSEGGTTSYPVVQYSYQVAGQTYQSSKRAPGMEVGGTGAGKVIARYPVGAQVMVFYDPQKPSDAVLERNAPAQWLMWFLLVVFDCALCGAIPLIWWSMNQ